MRQVPRFVCAVAFKHSSGFTKPGSDAWLSGSSSQTCGGSLQSGFCSNVSQQIADSMAPEAVSERGNSTNSSKYCKEILYSEAYHAAVSQQNWWRSTTVIEISLLR